MKRAYRLSMDMTADIRPLPAAAEGPDSGLSPVARRLERFRLQCAEERLRWRRMRNGLAAVALSLGALVLML